MPEFIRIATRPFRKFVKRCYRNFRSRLYHYTAGTWLSKFLPLLKKDERPVVYSLVCNPAVSDSRVLKQAAALTDAGYRVVVFCLAKKGLRTREQLNGIEFRRFDLRKKIENFRRENVFLVSNCFGKANIHLTQKKINFLEFESKYFEQSLRQRLIEKYPQLENRSNSVNQGFPLGKLDNGQTADKYRKEKAEKWISNRPYFTPYFFALNFIEQKFSPIPQFIHAHDIHTLPAALALAKRTGAKVVYDAHEIETERSTSYTLEDKAFILECESIWFKHIDAMITVSEEIADLYVLSHGCTRPVVVANSPVTNIQTDITFDIRKDCGLPLDVPLIGYTGGVGREGRGLHIVVEALKSIPQFHLAIVGPRHQANDNWLLSHIERYGVGAQVHFLDPVAPDQVVNYVKGIDIGICPYQNVSLNHVYAMPNKLYEMAFAKIPLCVSNLTAMANFVNQHKLGVVMDETSPTSIAKSLLNLYKYRGNYVMSDQALTDFADFWGWPNQARRLVDLYAKIK